MVPFFFASHWSLSVLFQSLFQHRYAAHRMFTMGPRTERALHLSTALVQGSSYLDPRAYAILHREHHAYVDTERDPHSPSHQKNPLRMMLHTARRYAGLLTRSISSEPRFLGGFPEWPAVDRLFSRWPTRITFGALYALFYWRFATRRWHWALLPMHFVLCMGELFQNNHHARPTSPDFAARRFELDPTWQVMRLLARMKLIRLTPASVGRHAEPRPSPVPRNGGTSLAASPSL
ncbi:acyl-CoA desaturase [Corallococcus sp. CA054B]|uniref:acyl-CoA desaturase n=1 Tax=Corallococcus sp. CA054B TaxID=2316734 RepID=UPI000EA1AFA8|nr:acyl-CoA desaturase [Corallococcus sp. CA054B]RKG71671.1 acyl-CoA desaturase [Corallococcus sp. CA054B]